MRAILSVRQDTAPLSPASLDAFATITTFAELLQEDSDSPPSAKKAKVEAAEEGKKESEADTQKERNVKELDGKKEEEESKGKTAKKGCENEES